MADKSPNRDETKRRRLLEKMRQNPTLVEMITKNPHLQQSIVELLESEMKFQLEQSNKNYSGSDRNNRRPFPHNRNQPSNDQQQNRRPLSPVEIKTIESMSSDEQNFLRHLLQTVLSDP